MYKYPKALRANFPPRQNLRRTMLAMLLLALGVIFGPSAALVARIYQPLENHWTFAFGQAGITDQAEPAPANFSPVTLPHTFNATDGDDGGTYFRGSGWYQTTIAKPSGNGRVWLEFDGATLVTDVWVGNHYIGKHEGGYSRFRFDVTDALTSGQNFLRVRVSNARFAHIAPLGGDFTIFGGLFRPVRLVIVPAQHFDLADFGGPGVYFTPTEVSGTEARATQARATVRLLLKNDEPIVQRRLVSVRLLEKNGQVAARFQQMVDIPANAQTTIEQTITINRPHLWQGRADPYLYKLEANLSTELGRLLDQVKFETGIRTFHVSAEHGALLNGRPYRLHGVNYQLTTRPQRGTAMGGQEIGQDLQLMDQLGLNAIRLAHMQHNQMEYDAADRAGIGLWTQAPLNSVSSGDSAYLANLAAQMSELIRQNQNHPSVLVWGIGNEIFAADQDAINSVAFLQQVAHRLDPSRQTSYAHCCADDLHPLGQQADIMSFNRYFGWYSGAIADFATWVDSFWERGGHRPFAISEYGAGASLSTQNESTEKPVPNSNFHPEYYQTLFHEAYWRAIRDRDYIWASFVWVGFDFPADSRAEGERLGVNDKGLVNYARTIRKDAYFWYQANWSNVPMVHITQSRFVNRPEGTMTVRAYSNQHMASLSINGHIYDSRPVMDHVATFENVPLSAGVNNMRVRAGNVSDTASFTH